MDGDHKGVEFPFLSQGRDYQPLGDDWGMEGGGMEQRGVYRAESGERAHRLNLAGAVRMYPHSSSEEKSGWEQGPG